MFEGFRDFDAAVAAGALTSEDSLSDPRVLPAYRGKGPDMQRFRRTGRAGKLLLAVGVAGGVFGIATVVQASIPDAGGAIHGCYNPNGARQTNGTTLNIVDSASASCGKNMQPVTWNQKGPTGAKGATGHSGPTGPVGISGYEIVRSSVMDPPNTETEAQAACPTGKVVLGGAGSVQGAPTGVWLHTGVTSFASFSSYDVIAVNTTATTQQINSVAICANVN